MNIKITLTLLLDLLMNCLNKIHQIKLTMPNVENDLKNNNNGPLGIEVIIVDIIAQQVEQIILKKKKKLKNRYKKKYVLKSSSF